MRIQQVIRTAGFRLGFLSAMAGMLTQPALAQTQPAPPAPAADPMDKVLDGIVAFEVKLGTDDWRQPKLRYSQREHAELALPGLGVTQRAFIVYPQKAEKAPVILMMPEDQGLNSWARSMADEIAAMGYIVVVPDLLAGRGPNGGGRESFPDLRSVFRIHSQLPRTDEPGMTAQLNFWADYAKALPRFNGKLAGVGFAWGAGRIMHFAVQRKDLAAVAIFYDAAPMPEKLAGLSAPLYGFYAEHDDRVTRSLERTRTAMKQLGKPYQEVIYPGSDHMFVRLGEEPRDDNPANIEARHASLARLQEILRGL
ncbi:dienelactone hydrolase family protein [Novosphingobium flavum]|uniref:Dienelactone hydrolase family protein n=1 Tax=Novosphingobium flavum TaxID=1778672 RepID=A0A7X1KLQ2_9SPHN|nr:dienelactone hydrolase family protein [Novosphingobium flavum]MBC2665846.1 dienelactone hydrolase family protein [Novosphingobium flavum]